MKDPQMLFSCSKCGAQTTKWAGRCTECGAWGTVKEDGDAVIPDAKKTAHTARAGTPAPFSGASMPQAHVRSTMFHALDATLGGGLVDGSVTLIAGEPGIGKSTLLAQAAIALAASGMRVLYVTGEESPAQIHRRLSRLSPVIPDTLLFLDETDAGIIAATVEKEKPALTIIDSVQTLRTADASGDAGSVTQVKACAALVTEAAKRAQASVVLVGQVTKDGDVAGPRLLEHLVDTVLFLEGDHEHRYRLLRVLKHRFGPTDEVALLSMTEQGLTEILDPSQELLRDRPLHAAGSAVTCLIEGHRALLLELQSLVSPAGYGTPVRRATGVDSARLGILLAVLAKRAGVNALDKDVYANAAGGMDARDPSVDLALAAAIASAVKDVALDPRVGLFGEIGLAGELRPVALPELRLKEFARMGFTKAIVPKGQGKGVKGIEVIEVSTLRQALEAAKIVG